MYLNELPLFAGLASEELADLAHSLGRRMFGRGVFIFHKGSPGQLLYIIESGRIRLFSISDTGQELSLNVLGPGEFFGELALLDGRPRSSGAVTLEPTVALLLHREDLLRLLDRSPCVARNLMCVLADRLRYTTHYVEDLAFLDVHSRVAARLLELASRYSVQECGVEIELCLTQSELASWVASSRESVNKVLMAFRSRGLIGVEGQRISILDRRGLERQILY
jgi:CRP/FNR family transcriptional regulator, cyclic AMP receptor protein